MEKQKKLTYKDIEERIRQINSETSSAAAEYFKKDVKISRSSPFFHAFIGLTFNLLFAKREKSGYNRFLDTFFYTLSDSLTRLKLLKLQNKI